MVSLIRGSSVGVRSLLILSLILGVVLTFQTVAGAIVTETPRRDLPIALDGAVWAVEQVGDTIVVGGTFTRVQTSRDGPVVIQPGIYAYDMDSGQFLEDFRPIITTPRGLVEVRDIEATGDGDSFFIGGRFTAIDDRTDGRARVRNRLAKLRVSDGRLDRNFAQAGVNAKVLTLEYGVNDQLYVGGNFTEVFDLAPGRPPVVQQAGGLARFDANTGQFDTDFRYESRQNIGAVVDNNTGARVTIFSSNDFSHVGGVARIHLNVDGNLLVVAHRGAEIYDVNRDIAHDAAGLAIIRTGLNGRQHRVEGFRALHPDPNDPIQEMYHAAQCGGRGVQIRDLDVVRGWLVVTHQGADTGQQCDTIVRYPINLSPVRPDWVARAFDSVFSVEIDGPYVYVGGHFRYLVDPSAPSPYPGQSRPQGVSGRDIYTADPDNPAETGVAFRDDLFNPGFVFENAQFGALDARTGYGIPSFNPVSDAAVGVLELTSIDRGLLVGQDRGRIGGFNVGRSAFLDNNPDAGNTRCDVDINADGDPVVTWVNIGNVNEWRIAANGSFVDLVPGSATQFVDTTQAPGTSVSYELRYNRNGLSLANECGSANLPAATLSCTATLDGRNAEVSWNDEGWSRVAVVRDGNFVANVDGGTSTYSETARPGDTFYSIRAFLNGERIEAQCGTVTAGAPPLTCTATLVGDEVNVSWNDEGWTTVSIRRNDRFVSNLERGVTSFSETAPPGTSSYSVRGFLAGSRVDADCGDITVAIGALNCTATVSGNEVTLSWNDEGWTSVSIRRDGVFLNNQSAGITSYSEDIPNGSATYALRGFLAGNRVDAACGTVTGDGPATPALTCTQNGTELSWTNVGAREYQVRTNGRWVTTTNDTSFTVDDAAGDHVIRYRLGGQRFDVSCN